MQDAGELHPSIPSVHWTSQLIDSGAEIQAVPDAPKEAQTSENAPTLPQGGKRVTGAGRVQPHPDFSIENQFTVSAKGLEHWGLKNHVIDGDTVLVQDKYFGQNICGVVVCSTFEHSTTQQFIRSGGA